MTEQQILEVFRKSLKKGDRVRHRSGWSLGIVVGKIHPAYETGVRFDGSSEETPVYAKNLYPEWWPTA